MKVLFIYLFLFPNTFVCVRDPQFRFPNSLQSNIKHQHRSTSTLTSNININIKHQHQHQHQPPHPHVKSITALSLSTLFMPSRHSRYAPAFSINKSPILSQKCQETRIDHALNPEKDLNQLCSLGPGNCDQFSNTSRLQQSPRQLSYSPYRPNQRSHFPNRDSVLRDCPQDCRYALSYRQEALTRFERCFWIRLGVADANVGGASDETRLRQNPVLDGVVAVIQHGVGDPFYDLKRFFKLRLVCVVVAKRKEDAVVEFVASCKG